MTMNRDRKPGGFRDFNLHRDLERGVADAGFTEPRPIQAQTIGAGLDGDDILGLAQTGTGKTAAFGLILLDWILRGRRRGVQALVLAPTRELAAQIGAELDVLAKHTRIRHALIYGGVPQVRQISRLQRGPEIVVGCPGRVLDLIEQGHLDLSGVEGVVLDEADQMFDMGFLPTVRRIMDALPDQRQTMLFSATMPQEVRHLADEMLIDPHVVELASRAPAATIDHGLVMIPERRKRDLLEHLLDRPDCRRAIVFTRTKRRTRALAEQLNKAGYRAVGLQGNLSQSQRDRAMRGFREQQFDVLVATDIAARGIDVSGVSHVINYDVPSTPEQYTHRIGRTGRAELEGVACTFVTGEDHAWLRATERMIGAPIRRETIAGFEAEPEPAALRPAPRRSPGGGAPRRGGGGGQAPKRWPRGGSPR
ncbi:MAG TPA: DEAD/DEAH box helicase [Candidatus Krumholzibacteria bacterium]|nr:DEAD/DEAH box helicase [Candidatus Krumholzibacteria bacterium]